MTKTGKRFVRDSCSSLNLLTALYDQINRNITNLKKRRTFFCGACNMKYHSRKKWSYHLKGHNREELQLMTCDECRLNLAAPSMLLTHYQEHHNKSHSLNPFTIDSPELEKISNEVLSKTHQTGFYCSYCKSAFTSYFLWKSHLKNFLFHPKRDPTSDKNFICPLCKLVVFCPSYSVLKHKLKHYREHIKHDKIPHYLTYRVKDCRKYKPVFYYKECNFFLKKRTTIFNLRGKLFDTPGINSNVSLHPNKFYCRLCNTRILTLQNWKIHCSGRAHFNKLFSVKKCIYGGVCKNCHLEEVMLFRPNGPDYLCRVCKKRLSMGPKYSLKYPFYFPQRKKCFKSCKKPFLQKVFCGLQSASDAPCRVCNEKLCIGPLRDLKYFIHFIYCKQFPNKYFNGYKKPLSHLVKKITFNYNEICRIKIEKPVKKKADFNCNEIHERKIEKNLVKKTTTFNYNEIHERKIKKKLTFINHSSVKINVTAAKKTKKQKQNKNKTKKRGKKNKKNKQN